MRYDYPANAAWWDALCFRLSGPENVPVRRLLAGSPELPREGFLALLEDKEPEVLGGLSENPSLPPDVALRLLRHPDGGEFLTESWFDRVLADPALSSDDLCLVMEHASGEGMEGALLHPNSDWTVVEDYFRCYGQVDDPVLAAKLLRRFPWGEHPQVWARIKEEAQWSRALLACPETPQAFLLWMAWEQRQQMAFDNYLHEISEEICGHPNADAEVFDVLMDDDVFQERDSDYDLPCIRLISEHPGASAKQRAAALLQVAGRDGGADGD